MARIGVQMMMLRDHVAVHGPYATLQRLHQIGLRSVEISQIPMTAENVEEFVRARDDLGVEVAAISATSTTQPGVNEPLDTMFDKIVDDCRRLGTRHIRIGMMPMSAMRSAEALRSFCTTVDEQARRLGDADIALHYHNHHLEFARRDGVRILDQIREWAPRLRFEIDVHWAQRGGDHPSSLLRHYAGLVDLVHLKDYRIGELPADVLDAAQAGDMTAWQAAWTNLVQFAEVGEGNLDWTDIIDTSLGIEAEHLLIEQDVLNGRDVFDCLATSRANLEALGHGALF